LLLAAAVAGLTQQVLMKIMVAVQVAQADTEPPLHILYQKEQLTQ
jgi:hypothetical protein